MKIFFNLSFLDPAITSDNATLVRCPIKVPLPLGDSSFFDAPAKVSTLLTIAVNFMTMPFTVVFNGLILFVVWKNPSLQVERVITLAYLAMADILMGLISQPLFIARAVLQLKTNDKNCAIDTVYLFFVFLISTSITHQLVLVTYERYVAIIHPFKYPTRITVRKLTYITIVLWALNTPLSIMYFVLMGVGASVWYIESLYAILGPCLAVLMVYWYVRILACIRRQNRQTARQQQRNPDIKNPSILENHKGAMTAGLLLACFLLSFIAMFIVFLFQQVLDFSFSGSVSLSLSYWVLTFFQLGSLINPIIYGLRVQEIRKKILQLLRFNINNIP